MQQPGEGSWGGPGGGGVVGGGGCGVGGVGGGGGGVGSGGVRIRPAIMPQTLEGDEKRESTRKKWSKRKARSSLRLACPPARGRLGGWQLRTGSGHYLPMVKRGSKKFREKFSSRSSVSHSTGRAQSSEVGVGVWG